VFFGGWLSKWQEESHQRAHEKAMRTQLESDSDSHVTLNSLTRDVLASVARVWRLTAYGKKAELLNKIIERMNDNMAVAYVCKTLNQAEKEALQWTLENGGWRSWKDFTEKYSDDLKDSPYWNYHEPETILGRLRRAGFLAKGTLNNEKVVFIPSDLRQSLINCLKT